MTYLIRRYPTAPYGTTLLGRAMGTIAHERYFWDMERQASAWLWFLPDVWPVSEIKKFIKSIFQRAYDQNYQNAYNEGAKQGDAVWKKITGDIDSTIRTLTSKINYAKALLDREIANLDSLTKSLNSEIKRFKSTVDATITDLKAKANDAIAKANRVVLDMESLRTQANAKFSEFSRSLTTFNSEIENAKSKISETVSNLLKLDKATADRFNDVWERLKRLEAQVSGIEYVPKEASFWEELKRKLGI